MSSQGDPDLEAAKTNGATKPNGSAVLQKTSWGLFNWVKSIKPVKRPLTPQGAPDGDDSTSCGAEFGLMRRTSELRNAVEAGDAKLAGEVIDCLNFKKSDGFSIQDVSGNGLLQISALQNKPEMTKMLLDKGFKINDIDSNHGTALQAAIYMDHLAVINILLDPNRPVKADVNAAGGYYGCALQVAAFKGSTSLMKRLLSLGAVVTTCGGKYDSVLQAAARTGLPSVVELVLDHSQENQDSLVNWEGGVYGTALQAAAKGDYTGTTRFLRCLSRGRVLKQPTNVPRKSSEEISDYLKVAKLLISRGAKVKCDGGRLGSPIGAAANSGNYEMLKLLVEHDKTPLELRKLPYSCALINAITQEVADDRLPLVKLLVDEGADIDFEKGSGLSNRPLTAAAAINSVTVMDFLLKRARNKEAKEARINAESGIYGTALRAALSAKAQNAALYLIKNGAGINTMKDESYGNILHLAVFSQMDQVVDLLLRDYRVAVNLRDEAGQTALHIAAYRGYRSTVSILLRYNADPDLEDAWGDTPRKIVEDVTERESHPGPSLEDLRDISHQLLVASAKLNRHKPDDLVHGPPIWKKPQASLTEQGTAKPVFSSPIWNPGLGFKATISEFLQKEGDEYISIKTLFMDDLLYRKGAVDELMKLKDPGYTKNLRWYHIPSNNMTWAEMLMKILWAEKHHKTTCKSFWGTDPYFVSPDLAPHARFVTPQCERLIPDASEGPEPPSKVTNQPDLKQPPKDNLPLKDKEPLEVTEKPKNTLFLAMPYLHWESYRSSEAVSKLLKKIKDDSMQNLILRGGKSWRTYEAEPKPLTRSTVLDSAEQKEEPVAVTTNDKTADEDDELLEKYLFKRWPIHLRRTLDQYYYSYLADTRIRDGDQVVTKVRNRELYLNELAIRSRSHIHTEKPQIVEKQATKSKNRGKRHTIFSRNREATPENSKSETPTPPKDKNSPLVIVDQLWLWVLDRDTIITSFPSRRLDKEEGDLDTENKTDVLETILRYLRSAKRHPIRDAYDLSELIISQCIGILHRADVISDLDFLKIFGTEADRRVDQVMQKLTAFVTDFRKFMDYVKKSQRIDNTYIKDFEKIFNVTEEALLLREIQDIKDELNMLTAVFQDQLGVLHKAGKDIAEDRKKLPETRSSAFNFQQQSEKHARHVERMRVQASQAYDTLKDLLDLKQQQANVLEARVSRNQSLAAKEQGKIILVFTIVTIIFLPLTFMTTVFTLPVLTFDRWDPSNSTMPKPDGGLLKSGNTFGVIVGVSILMAVPAIVAAFQVRRLQRWWEEGQAWWQTKQMEQQENQSQENQLKEKPT